MKFPELVSYISFIDSIEINPTELCNLKCEFCPRAHGYPNLNYHMSVETIDKLCESIEEFCSHPDIRYRVGVYITGRGEPALCKNLGYLLESLLALQDKGIIYVGVNTNGYKFWKYFELYKRCHVVGINLYNNFTRQKYEEFVDRYGSYENFTIQFRRGNVLETPDEGPFTINYTNRTGAVNTDITTIKQVVDTRCDIPIHLLYVDWNGDYNLCCHDWSVVKVFGNLHEMSIVDLVMHNKEFAKYRTDLSKGIRCMKPCSDCNYVADERHTSIPIIEEFRKHENRIRQRNI